MKLRPIKGTFIIGARGFITPDGLCGLHLYPRSGKPFSIAFEPQSIEHMEAILQRLKSALATGERGTVH